MFIGAPSVQRWIAGCLLAKAEYFPRTRRRNRRGRVFEPRRSYRRLAVSRPSERCVVLRRSCCHRRVVGEGARPDQPAPESNATYEVLAAHGALVVCLHLQTFLARRAANSAGRTFCAAPLGWLKFWVWG